MTKSKIKDDSKFSCTYCKREFVRENSLLKHLCEQKRRRLNKNEYYVRLGFQAYRRFFELHYKRSKSDYEEFCNSKLYIQFTNFGRYLEKNKIIDPMHYIDWVLTSNRPIRDWQKESVYEQYLKEKLRSEDPEQAIERMIHNMQVWSAEKMLDWQDFFRNISTNEAVLWFKIGKISPWIIFCMPSAELLVREMNEDQMTQLERCIDFDFWKTKVARNKKRVEEIREIMRESGL